MSRFRVLARGLVAAGGLVIAVSSAVAQSQPIKVLIGFPPGGTTDIIGRIVAQELAEHSGRAVVVENKAGASGSVAAATVAKSKPDGGTILFAPSSHATNPSLQKSLPFDTVKDFVAVGLVATTPYVLVVHPSVPAQDFGSFVSYLKRNPGQVMFASASAGTGQHLAAELFKKEANVQISHVPYRGSAAALTDLISGRVPMMFDNVAVMVPNIKSGALRPLATTGSRRSSLLPDVPTVDEGGLRGFEVEGWFAAFVPAKTPQHIIDELNKVLIAMMDKPEVVARLSALGATPKRMTPQAADALVRAEVGKWKAVIQEANITVD